MPFKNDTYEFKAYKHLENLEAMYEDLCNMSGILPFIDNVFLPSGDVDIEKSILKITNDLQNQIKFMKKECKF